MTVRITKLPPGKAMGADDLQRWAARRLAGHGGLPKTKRARKFAKARTEAQDETAKWLAEAERRARRKDGAP